ncbi:DNA polymerase III subunit beta [Larkinella ripae]
MKLIIASHALKKALSFVGQAILPNPIVPVMENVRIDVSGGTATLTGSDLHTTLICDVPVESFGETSALLPFKRLNDLLFSAPEGPTTIQFNPDGFAHKVALTSGKYTLTGEDPALYNLKDDEPEIEHRVLFNEQEKYLLLSGLASVSYACGNNEMMPHTTGVYWHFADTLRLVASDGKTRVIRADTGLSMEGGRNIIVPASFCKKLVSLSKDLAPTDSLLVQLSDRKIIVLAGQRTLKAMLIDENYLPYEGAIVTNHDKEIIVNRLELATSIKRVSLFCDTITRMIRLSLTPDGIQIAADDAAYGVDAHETILTEYTGEPLDLGFDSSMLLELLRNLEGETITLKMSTPSRGTLIIDENTTGVIFSHHINQPVTA